MTRSTTVRGVIVIAMGVLVALAAGRIFDQPQPVLAVAALGPGAVTLAVMTAWDRRRWRRANGPATETATETATEPHTEPATEPVTEPHTEPVTEPLTAGTTAAAAAAGTVVAASVVAATTVAVAVTSWRTGAEGSVARAAIETWTRGPRRVVSTDWPSPVLPDLVGTAAAVVAVATAVSVAAATRPRWHLVPLVPLGAAVLAVTALSAPAGPAVAPLVGLGALAVVLAALPARGTVADRWKVVAGERRAVVAGALAAAAVVTAAVAVTADHSARADPRRPEPPAGTASLLDPVEAAAALRALDPPVALYEVSAEARSGEGAAPAGGPSAGEATRWRTSALTLYDGRRWSPGVALHPIGRRLAVDVSPTLVVEVDVLTADLDTVPLPGRPVTVEASDRNVVTTDADRSMVVLQPRASAGSTVTLTAAATASRASAASTPARVRPIDDVAGRFTGTAERLAGDGTVVERLTRVESVMRDEFQLDPGAPGSGLQRALMERFLSDTRRGTAEQFTTGFVLLARAMGVDARVATGFVTEPLTDGTRLVISSADAAVWPEVRFEGVGWVPFDPVPEQVTLDDAESPPPPRVQSPAAVQPPVAPPSPRTDTDEPSEPTDPAVTAGGWSQVLAAVARTALIALAVVGPLAGLVGGILAAKAVRRRRRLGAADPRLRVRGAWAEATDALVDAGLRIRSSWTDHDIAAAGAVLAPSAPAELRRLGAMSASATFAAPSALDAARTRRQADEAIATLTHIERALADERTRWQRWRWRLSLRSLRRSTRSPVLGDAAPASPRHG